MKHFAAAALLLLAAVPFAAQSPQLTDAGRVDPARPPRAADAPIDLRKLDAIEPLVTQAIGEEKLPGAVVLVGRGDRTLYQKAIGHRALLPAPEPMTLDTMFDLASLTKVVATTTSVMILIEEGELLIWDLVHA